MHPLEELLNFPSESRIVGLLSMAPTRAHSRTEICRRLKIKPAVFDSSIRAIIEKKWIIFSSQENRETLYLLNLKYAPARELRQGLLKGKPQPQDDLMSGIKKLGNIKTAILSGMFTGQTQLPVDLLIVGTVNEVNLKNFLKTCLDDFGRELNYTIFSEEEFKERQNIFDRFLRDIFDHPHLIVIDKL